MISQYKVFDKVYELEDVCVPLGIGENKSGRDNSSLSVPFSPQYVKVVTMCLHISPNCNLDCKYCFKKIGGELTLNDIKRFIDCVLQIYPNADRYIVDMSGGGEPLLHKELALKIAKYCNELSDKYLREFLPTFVTNGVLLTPDMAKELQEAGILFGISLDGTKERHDKNRIFKNGKGSYDIVSNNIKNIEHKDYVGAAMTYADGNLLDDFLSMSKLLPTVSMKPVRSDKGLNVEEICNGYDELIKFLLDKTVEGKTSYIFSLINGDDYFGKFLKRVLLNITTYGRCDAGIARFSLGGDKRIYACPASVGIEDGCVGDLDYGIRLKNIYRAWDKQKNELCNGCFARSACGGECKVVSYNKYGNFDEVDPDMCKIKRHIYLLAKYFVDTIKERSKTTYQWLIEQSQKIEGYYSRDEKLIFVAERMRGQLTYTELKRIKDNEPQKFNEIYEKLKIYKLFS